MVRPFAAQVPNAASYHAANRERVRGKSLLVVKRKQSKAAILRAVYAKAQESVALPVRLESQAIATFRLILAQHHLELCRIRAELEETSHELLQEQLDYQILRSVPGVGPIIALTVLAEAGDLRRFGHQRKFLKCCGLDLATSQSGAYRGHLIIEAWQQQITLNSMDGCQMRYPMNENTFRLKFNRCMQSDPTNTDLRRKAYTACTAKMARTICRLIKHRQFYRAYNEDAIPELGGRTRSHGPLRQAAAVA